MDFTLGRNYVAQYPTLAKPYIINSCIECTNITTYTKQAPLLERHPL